MSVIPLNPNQTKSFDIRLDDVEAHIAVVENDNITFKAEAAQDNTNFKADISQDIENFKGEINPQIETINSSLNNIVQIVNNAMTQVEIQSILNTSKRVRIKSGTYNIDISSGSGFILPSSITIDFEDGVNFQALSSSLENYQIIKIADVHDVIINSPNIIGERNSHVGTTGEWGHGIYINNSKNITINKAKCSNCWGDGIYIGDLNENIVIKNPICDNNRRQGISVISCKGLLIENPISKNTNGTLPEAGIDFEPNLGSNGLENIRVVNPYTENNNGGGITIALLLLGGTAKIVDITIENHRDNGSRNGLYIGEVIQGLNGSIVYNNSILINNKNNSIYVRNYSINAPKIEINSPTSINPNRTLLGSNTFDSAMLVNRNSGDNSSSDLGNIYISKPTIVSDTNTKTGIFMGDYDPSRTLKKCSIVDILNISSAIQSKVTRYVDTLNISDKYSQLKQTITTASTTIYSNNVYSVIDNNGAGVNTTINLSPNLCIGWEVEFKVVTNKYIIIVPGASEIILPNNTIVGKGIISTAVGSRIKLKKVSATEWDIVEIVGTWSQQA